MSDPLIYSEFTGFIEKYKDYFLSNDLVWYQNLQKVCEYIDQNNKKPSNSDKNEEQIEHLLESVKTNQKELNKIMDSLFIQLKNIGIK